MQSAHATPLSAVLERLKECESAILKRFIDVLRIPSISTSAEHRPDVERAAHWAADHARASGLIAEVVTHEHGLPATVVQTPDDRLASPDVPTLLFYGHHDVQPAAQRDGWVD
ncbi:MAG: peptidase M20, partial [Planctomycetota bacterium]